jgi:hypothetical protein
MIQIGGGKKKNKGKKSKPVNVEEQYEDPFVHDILVIHKFSQVGMSPPNLPGDLDDCIEKLKERAAELFKDGEDEQKNALEARKIEI